MVASDAISLDRYPADLRHEECKHYQYPERLPASSVIFVFHNEGWSTLVRSIHSVINFTPPELLEEVVLIDDGSNKEHITGGRLEEHIKQWNGLVKVIYFIKNKLFNISSFTETIAEKVSFALDQLALEKLSDLFSSISMLTVKSNQTGLCP